MQAASTDASIIEACGRWRTALGATCSAGGGSCGQDPVARTQCWGEADRFGDRYQHRLAVRLLSARCLDKNKVACPLFPSPLGSLSYISPKSICGRLPDHIAAQPALG